MATSPTTQPRIIPQILAQTLNAHTVIHILLEIDTQLNLLNTRSRLTLRAFHSTLDDLSDILKQHLAQRPEPSND